MLENPIKLGYGIFTIRILLNSYVLLKILIKCLDDIYLIIGSFDYEIKVFYINNGIIYKQYNQHTSAVLGIKTIKDKNNNQYFVSYGTDNNIYFNIYLWSIK